MSRRTSAWLSKQTTETLRASLERLHQQKGGNTYREKRAHADQCVAIENELERRGSIPPFAERMAELVEAVRGERWARENNVPALTLINAVNRTDAALARVGGAS